MKTCKTQHGWTKVKTDDNRNLKIYQKKRIRKMRVEKSS